MSTNEAAVSKALDYLRDITWVTPRLAIICGTGLGGLADILEKQLVVPYASIPGFPQTTVQGHKGNLVFGYLSGKPVVVMQGRFHQYEGFDKKEITLPIRTLWNLGVEKLIVTCASGGLNPKLKTGDFVVLEDHISFSSFTTDNVLAGINEKVFGPRFVATSDAYCLKLRQQLLKTAIELGFESRIHTGVYFHVLGPTFSSRAESRAQLILGGDVVGMSTVPEVLTARHCGLDVVAVALVTDMCAMPGDTREPVTEEEVYTNVERCAEDMKRLISTFVKVL